MPQMFPIQPKLLIFAFGNFEVIVKRTAPQVLPCLQFSQCLLMEHCALFLCCCNPASSKSAIHATRTSGRDSSTQTSDFPPTEHGTTWVTEESTTAKSITDSSTEREIMSKSTNTDAVTKFLGAISTLSSFDHVSTVTNSNSDGIGSTQHASSSSYESSLSGATNLHGLSHASIPSTLSTDSATQNEEDTRSMMLSTETGIQGSAMPTEDSVSLEQNIPSTLASTDSMREQINTVTESNESTSYTPKTGSTESVVDLDSQKTTSHDQSEPTSLWPGER